MKKPFAIILAAVLLGGVVGYAVSRHPFTDVPDGAYYADAVQWAWEQLRSQGNGRWEGPLGTPLGLVHWKRASSPVEAGTSGFL